MKCAVLQMIASVLEDKIIAAPFSSVLQEATCSTQQRLNHARVSRGVRVMLQKKPKMVHRYQMGYLPEQSILSSRPEMLTSRNQDDGGTLHLISQSKTIRVL
jgi:hypothetical protein